MTMSTVADICGEVSDIVAAVDGIRSATTEPLEVNNIKDVTAVVLRNRGEFVESTDGIAEGRTTIRVYVITPRRNLRTDYARLSALTDTVPRALLLNRTLNDTVLEIEGIRWETIPDEWGGELQTGWIFEVDVLASGTLS